MTTSAAVITIAAPGLASRTQKQGTRARLELRSSSPEQKQRIRAMLLRYRDALDEQKAGNAGADGKDSRQLLLPGSFNAAFRELDLWLEAMREGTELRRARWHLIAWFVDVDYVQVPIFTRRMSREGWVRERTGFRLEPRRHRDARELEAENGVAWCAGRYRWERVHLKAIADACGESV